jgi:hypothetical protein
MIADSAAKITVTSPTTTLQVWAPAVLAFNAVRGATVRTILAAVDSVSPTYLRHEKPASTPVRLGPGVSHEADSFFATLSWWY